MLDAFMQNVIRDPSGCWLWNGERDRYGAFNGKPAHRVSWELHQGPILDGLFILHGCDVKGCVNPAHLRPGTSRENARDIARARARGRSVVPVNAAQLVLTTQLSGEDAAGWRRIAQARGLTAQQLFDAMLVEAGDPWIEEAEARLDALERAHRRAG